MMSIVVKRLQQVNGSLATVATRYIISTRDYRLIPSWVQRESREFYRWIIRTVGLSHR